MKAVHIVIRPKQNVMNENHILGPKVRTAIVDGNWNAMLAIVKMKILTDIRSPSRPISAGIEVTKQRMPAIVHSRKSTLSRSRRSMLRSWSSSSADSESGRGNVASSGCGFAIELRDETSVPDAVASAMVESVPSIAFITT